MKAVAVLMPFTVHMGTCFAKSALSSICLLEGSPESLWFRDRSFGCLMIGPFLI